MTVVEMEEPSGDLEEFEGDIGETEAEPFTRLQSSRGAADRERAALDIYLAEISRLPRLTREQEQVLAHRVMEGDEAAQRQLVEANLRLVLRLARRYLGRGLPLIDLIEEGNIGLMHATKRYRPDRGTRFGTYAAWWIRQAISRALTNQARLIRLPVHVEVLLARYLTVKEELAGTFGRPATIAEIADHLNVPVEGLTLFEAVSRRPISFEAPQSDKEEGVIGEFLPDPGVIPPDELLTAQRRPGWEELFSHLRPNERVVLEDRFGLKGREPMTLDAIGRELGLTRERIRQIEASGLRRLKTLLMHRET